MGDRCYMQITCRRQDQERFEELGFHRESEQPLDTPIVEMIDEEANYAHYNSLPTDIPYHGYHGAGGEYGAHELACDGHTYADVESGRDGDYVVKWDAETQQPAPASLQRIRHFLAVLETARQQLAATTTLAELVGEQHPPAT